MEITPVDQNTLIENVKTTRYILKVDDTALPITVNQNEFTNSYVCSPYGHYVGYCYDAVFGVKKIVFKPLIDIYGAVLKGCKINRVVIVNNRLFATNLYPELNEEQIKKIRDFLIKRFPKHAIVFRTINEAIFPELYNHLTKNGFDLIASRMIYYTRAENESAFKSRMFKSDLAILKDSSYEVVSLSYSDAPRAAELYRMLNVTKYSELNPQFNQDFVRLALENNSLTFFGLKKEGRLDGVVGYYSIGNVMTSPFFGYDTNLPADFGLYRQLSTILLQKAKAENKLLHQSSGAGNFKKLRRAESIIEYNAIYTKHLSFKQRAAFGFLKYAMNTFGVKLMDKF